jgi:hypothetical protein
MSPSESLPLSFFHLFISLIMKSLDPDDKEFGVTCKHGPLECAGNVQQLCVNLYEPLSVWWEFVQCQNYEGIKKIGTPELALQCARAIGLDWETSRAGRCAGLDGSGKGAEGVQLLQESVVATKAVGVKKSCSVIINNEIVCVHDDTWKECEVYVPSYF